MTYIQYEGLIFSDFFCNNIYLFYKFQDEQVLENATIKVLSIRLDSSKANVKQQCSNKSPASTIYFLSIHWINNKQ